MVSGLLSDSYCSRLYLYSFSVEKCQHLRAQTSSHKICAVLDARPICSCGEGRRVPIVCLDLHFRRLVVWPLHRRMKPRGSSRCLLGTDTLIVGGLNAYRMDQAGEQ